MKKIIFSLLFISVLIFNASSLPVKEAPTSTEKDPNAHKKEDDSPTHNLENIIGKREMKKIQTSSFSRHHQ
jgi:hypothetical protein